MDKVKSFFEGDKVKRFFDGFSSRIAADIAAGFVLKLLENKTPKDCYMAIRDDINLYESAPKPAKERGLLLARRFRPHLVRYLNMIDDEVVLNFLKEDRSDLAGIIINYPEKKGRVWFKKQCDLIKDNMKNYFGIE